MTVTVSALLGSTDPGGILYYLREGVKNHWCLNCVGVVAGCGRR